MTEQPLVDIMLPFWGEPAYLFEAVRSVQSQSDEGWRLTVVDDAYPDPTVRDFFDTLRDHRIRYLRNEQNLGIIGNFQRAADLSDAPLTVILGSDDRLHADYVRDVRAAWHESTEIDVIAPAVEVIDESGMPHRPLADRVKAMLAPRTGVGPVVLSGPALIASLTRGNWLYWPSLAIRTERLHTLTFRTDLPIILDLALLLDIAFDDGRLLYMNGDARFFYRRHRSSLSQTAIIDGVRFRDEARFHRETARRALRAGWVTPAAWAALRPSSRLHAAAALPNVLRARDGRGLRAALGNAFGV